MAILYITYTTWPEKKSRNLNELGISEFSDFFVMHPNWGHEARFNDANRFNVLRACSDGRTLLGEDQKAAQQKATSPRAQAQVKKEGAYRAKVAGALSVVHVDNADLAKRQAENALQLLALIERSYSGRAHTFAGRLSGRLLINMAGGVQEQAGMALDRCFGLPYIPGSAVKGVARSAALWDIRRTSEHELKTRKLQLALLAFGFIKGDISRSGQKVGDFVWAAGSEPLVREAGNPWTENDSFKGLLSFLPAYPIETPEIVAEVLTPHPRAGKTSDPHPVFFPAVEANSCFGFAIVASRSPKGADVNAALAQAGAWLRTAVSEQGIGAKTGAGYGWFTLDPQAEDMRRAALAELNRREEQERLDAEVTARAQLAEKERLAALSPHERRAQDLERELNESTFAEFAKTVAEKPDVDRHAFCLLLAGRHRDRWKKWKKSEKWQDHIARIQQLAAGYGIQLS